MDKKYIRLFNKIHMKAFNNNSADKDKIPFYTQEKQFNIIAIIIFIPKDNYFMINNNRV